MDWKQRIAFYRVTEYCSLRGTFEVTVYWVSCHRQDVILQLAKKIVPYSYERYRSDFWTDYELCVG
jgi:hypothetical protein